MSFRGAARRRGIGDACSCPGPDRENRLNYISWLFVYGLGVDRLARNGSVSLVTWVIIFRSIGYALVGTAVGLLWGILIHRARKTAPPSAAFFRRLQTQ
jgi:hypothetical protein